MLNFEEADSSSNGCCGRVKSVGIDAESTDENGLQQAKLEAAEPLENEVAVVEVWKI